MYGEVIPWNGTTGALSLWTCFYQTFHKKVVSTVQSRFSDIKFSDDLWFSEYFSKTFYNLLHRIIRFSDIMQFSDSFCVDQNWHYIEIALYSKSTLISFGSYCSWLSYFFLCLCYQNWHDKVLDYIVPVLPLASCNVVFALSYNAEWLAVIVFIILV